MMKAAGTIVTKKVTVMWPHHCHFLGDYVPAAFNAAALDAHGARGAVGGMVPCSRAPQSWY